MTTTAFAQRKQLYLDIHDKLIVDLFAGGGGFSVAMEMAWGRSPDIAINHNETALSMHQMNHPETRHYIADVYEVNPYEATNYRDVGWLHLSPDCTDHSQAAGGQPRSKKIRSLSWVGYRWGGQVAPDIISLENVKQITAWSPLIAKRDPATGRVVTLDIVTDSITGKKSYRVANPGERVPVQQQYLVPDPKRKGESWKKFLRALRELGYVIETRLIVAADYGGHTTRERLFMIARRDGKPIVWQFLTHSKTGANGLPKWHQAADCIDFSDLGKSIFNRKKPLADATYARIAKGVQRYVLTNANPFIVPIAHYNGSTLVHPITEPLRTITSATKGGEFALASPVLVPADSKSRSQDDVIACGYLMQANGGFNQTLGRGLDEPFTTVTNTGSQQQLVSAFLARLQCDAGTENHLRSVSKHSDSGAEGLLEYSFSPEDHAGSMRVAAFLMEYYSEGGQWCALDKPINTITTKGRLALVTVFVRGVPYVIVDIRLRMLKPRELFRAQDFPDSYVIDRGHDGRKFSIEEQTRMCGNSVDPLMAVGFLRANAPHMQIRRAA